MKPTPTQTQIELAEAHINRSHGGSRDEAYMSALNADNRNRYDEAVLVYVPWKNRETVEADEIKTSIMEKLEDIQSKTEELKQLLNK